MREGHSLQQIGRKGLSNHRWIVGGKLCLLLNQWGLIVGWACATANVADNTFQWLIRQVEEQMIAHSIEFSGERIASYTYCISRHNFSGGKQLRV